MNTHTLLLTTAFLLLISVAKAQTSELPHLERTATGTQLIVDSKPFIMLAGELHNSSTGSVHHMMPLWKKMREKNLNTVITPVTWELTEPEEGRFDFTLVDSMIAGARHENLKLVLLWFGSWKNGSSTYVPAWVKKNTKRFPLVRYDNGEAYNTLSPLSNNSMLADAKAFGELMRHLKEVDKEHTVLMVQLENEIGTLDFSAFSKKTPNRSMRDYSATANTAFKGQVPEALMRYLNEHKRDLHPAIAKAWKSNGARNKGTWEQVFGKGLPPKAFDRNAPGVMTDNAWQDEYPYLTEEVFNAWYYASYVEKLAVKAKEIYPLPLFVNAWIKQRFGREPGVYPSGGAQPHLFDIWRAAAPDIDIFATDIYSIDIYDWVCSSFNSKNNPLFIPETTATPDGAARAFYTFGKYQTLCYSPFGIDDKSIANDPSFANAYGMLAHLQPLINKYSATERMTGLMVSKDHMSDVKTMGKYNVRASSLDSGDVAGLIVFQIADDEFIIAGGVGGIVASFEKSTNNKANHVAMLSLDEITFDAYGRPLYHRLNGDELTATIHKGEVKAFKVKLYEY